MLFFYKVCCSAFNYTLRRTIRFPSKGNCVVLLLLFSRFGPAFVCHVVSSFTHAACAFYCLCSHFPDFCILLCVFSSSSAAEELPSQITLLHFAEIERLYKRGEETPLLYVCSIILGGYAPQGFNAQ